MLPSGLIINGYFHDQIQMPVMTYHLNRKEMDIPFYRSDFIDCFP